FLMKEDQLREDQRREALMRREDPTPEETLPPPAARVEEPAPRVEEPAPRVEEPRPPKVDSRELLETAGLVMIETDRSKAPAQPAADEPQQPLGRPRRERAKAATQDEPLEQVETKR
ncbi:MAG TPA: hypothetical protein VJQ58_03255, partial [Burkholderiales bacterium]|nr:hypothetical protein [Burkholderiales bacterium]